MKRVSLLILSLSLCLISWASGTIMLNDIEYSLDTLQIFKAGPGTEYISIRMFKTSNGLGRLDAYLLIVDSKNQYVNFESVLGKDRLVGVEKPTSMAARKSTDTHILFAGTNGDFFQTSGDTGCPVGMSIINNEFAFVASDMTNRRVGGITEDLKSAIATYGVFSGAVTLADESSYPISRVNNNRNEDNIIMYNDYYGDNTRTNAYGTEVLVEPLEGEKWHTCGAVKAKVLQVVKNVGSMTIPSRQIVLSGHGKGAEFLNNLNEGDELTISTKLLIDDVETNVAQSVAGDPYALIVNNGQVEYSNFWNENHPRTGFGSTQYGDTLLLCVVDGRGKSAGCTTKVLGEILHHYGAYKAVNWDGGGSSCLLIDKFGQMNDGSDGYERSVGNGMFVVADVPDVDNAIAELGTYNAPLYMPRNGAIVPKMIGYNKYGVIVDTDVQGVKFSCDAATGYVTEDNQFVALTDGKVTASLGDITCDIPVRIIQEADVAFRFDTVWVSNDTYYSIEAGCKVGVTDMMLLPSALSWVIEDPTICEISDAGVLNGLKNGSTHVYGSLEDFADTIVVVVEIPDARPLKWDDLGQLMREWKIKPSSSAWNTQLAVNNEGKAEISLTYKTARNPNIRLEPNANLYSLPLSVEVRFNPNNFPLEKVIVGLQAHNGLTPIMYNYDSIAPNAMNVIKIDLDSLFEANGDIAIYPVAFSFMTLQMITKSAAEAYNLTFDGIYLNYKDYSLGFEEVPTEKGSVDGKTHVFDLQGREYPSIERAPMGVLIIQTAESTIKTIKY